MIARRAFTRAGIGAVTTMRAGIGAVAFLPLAACHKDWTLCAQDLKPGGTVADLRFTMTEAETGRTVTASDVRGKVVLLYFGYTNCPDVCPITLQETARILGRLGRKADQVRVLFVTVDPRRDTDAVLSHYLSLFGRPEFTGLRGTPAQLHALAARCHAAYAVHPSADPARYTVTHTAAAYVFDRTGRPQFICAGLSSKTPDLPGITNDLAHVIG
jgi:protein SCO1/2